MPKAFAQTSKSPKAAGRHAGLLKAFGLDPSKPLKGAAHGGTWLGSGPSLTVRTPIDGSTLATVAEASPKDYDKVAARLHEAFLLWRQVPAPKRGELVRQWGNALREAKDPLGRLVSLEMGKSLQEGWGEVQEMIDICDFAVGLSRTLGGHTLPSERRDHRMMEQWHPLGGWGSIPGSNSLAAAFPG